MKKSLIKLNKTSNYRIKWSEEAGSNVTAFLQTIQTVNNQRRKKVKSLVKVLVPVFFIIILGISLVIYFFPSKNVTTESDQFLNHVTTKSATHAQLCKQKQCLFGSECQIFNFTLEIGWELHAKCICLENYSGDRCEIYSPYDFMIY